MAPREAGPADADAIIALHVASWRATYRGILPDAFLAAPLEAALGAKWRDLFARGLPPGALLVAEDSAGLAGFVAAWRRPAGAEVDNLHVRPGLHGRGLGRRLLGEAARRLHAMGCRAAWLEVLEGNDAALRFYTRLGGRAGPLTTAPLHGLPAIPERRVAFDDLDALAAACLMPAGGPGGAAAREVEGR